jgi:hypothetical protein
MAGLRPGSIISPTASAKMALRALARRWLALDAEINVFDTALETLVGARAPALMESYHTAYRTAPSPICLSCSVTIRSVSAPKQRSPSFAASARSRPQASRPTGTASTVEVTVVPAPRFIALQSFACGNIRQRSRTSNAAPPKLNHHAKSAAASNATLPARSSIISASIAQRPPKKPLDLV